MRKVAVCSVEEAMRKMAEKNGIQYEPDGKGDSLMVDDNGVLIKTGLKEDGTVFARRENAIVLQEKTHTLSNRENTPITGVMGMRVSAKGAHMKEIQDG